jgi:hypothetical protein
MSAEIYSGLPTITFHPATDDKGWFFSVREKFTALWTSEDGLTSVNVIIPEYFETDLASIPQWLQSLIPLVGNHLQAAIVHDMCYRSKIGVSRKDADDMFYDSMRSLGVSWWKAQTMYRAVRAFGWMSFKGGV